MLETPDLRWLAAALVALIVAGVFAVFVPNMEKVSAATGLQYFIVRWGHSLVWVLLATAFVMFATQDQTLMAWANPVAAAGGLMYLVFTVNFLRL